jgi:glycosyltransferase involved in cell wall biosynthesis
MKILIVSRSFYPTNTPRAFRTTELVKEFSRQGHNVTLLTLKKEEVHGPFENEHGVEILHLGDLKLPALDTQSKFKPWEYAKRAFRRSLYMLFEYPDIELMWKVKRKLAGMDGYDLLISIAVPHPIHWGVAAARTDSRSIADTWIADCGDPYMGADMDSFRKLFYFKYFEKAFCRKADFITVPIEGAIEAYFPEFHEKIKVIPQGFNFEEVPVNKNDYRPNEVPTFAYAGGLIPGLRDPRPFLDQITDLDSDWKFILYTRDRNLIEPHMEKAGDKIEIRDYIPRPELLQTLSKMDFLVNFENSSPKMMPSKLIDYHIAGRPILPVNGSGADPETLENFLSGNYAGAFEYPDIERFRIENVCARFLELTELKNHEGRK